MSCMSVIIPRVPFTFFFFFNDTATTEIYTLSLHDALPISPARLTTDPAARHHLPPGSDGGDPRHRDRKSTRLNSSHSQISYAVFCLKKKQSHIADQKIINIRTIRYGCRPLVGGLH